MKFRSLYDLGDGDYSFPGLDEKGKPIGFGPSKAKQAFRDECDINNIMKRYEETGVLPETRAGIEAQYGDFSQIGDYQKSLNQVLLAEEMFNAMPVKVRDRFNNDPRAFVAFCSDKNNQKELDELGLGKPKADVPASSTPSTGVPQKGDTGGAPSASGQAPSASGQNNDGVKPSSSTK